MSMEDMFIRLLLYAVVLFAIGVSFTPSEIKLALSEVADCIEASPAVRTNLHLAYRYNKKMPPKKRKLYANYGSDAKIPKRTGRHWNQQQNIENPETSQLPAEISIDAVDFHNIENTSQQASSQCFGSAGPCNRNSSGDTCIIGRADEDEDQYLGDNSEKEFGSASPTHTSKFADEKEQSSSHQHPDDNSGNELGNGVRPTCSSEWVEACEVNSDECEEGGYDEGHATEPSDHQHENFENNKNDDLRSPYRGFSPADLKHFVINNSMRVSCGQNNQHFQTIMKWAKMMSPGNGYCQSQYLTDKIRDTFAARSEIHHVCKECNNYIGEIGSADATFHCDNCDNDISIEKNLGSNSFFLYMPLTAQLEMLFATHGEEILYHKNRIKTVKYAIQDVLDGSLYRKNRKDDMISAIFAYDGLPIFKSSHFSLHPIVCTIPEIAPDKRKNHVFITGVWFGRHKPTVDVFFIPFVNECNKLYDEGFNYVHKGCKKNLKVRVLMGICDSVARCDVRGTKQFNGLFGCGFCKNPGKSIEKGEKGGHARVYLVDSVNDNPYGEGLRTSEEIDEYVKNLDYGVKRKSILCSLKNFNIISGLPPDWMHNTGLGVCKQFANIWFDPANKLKDFGISDKIDTVDKILLSFKPPLEVTRATRKMSDRANWKAHEFVTWLLFESLVTLRQVLPLKFVQHWALLVEGISILLKDSIMKAEIAHADFCLIRFVKEIPELYGTEEYNTFNVHLLTHLALSVLQWGPLWTHSAFLYEDYYQQIIKFVKNSQSVALQVCNNFRLRQVVFHLHDLLADEFQSIHLKFIEEMLYNKTAEDWPEIDNVKLINQPVTEKLKKSHYLAFTRINIFLDRDSKYAYYLRIKCNNEIIHSKDYVKVKKRNSYTVLLDSDDVFEIQTFIVVKNNGLDECYALGYYFPKSNKRLVQEMRLCHMIMLNDKSENLAVVRCSSIREKIFILHVRKFGYYVACKHPTRNERLV